MFLLKKYSIWLALVLVELLVEARICRNLPNQLDLLEFLRCRPDLNLFCITRDLGEGRLLERYHRQDERRLQTSSTLFPSQRSCRNALKRPAENLNRGDSRGANFVIHSVWEDGSCQHHCQRRCGRDFRD